MKLRGCLKNIGFLLIALLPSGVAHAEFDQAPPSLSDARDTQFTVDPSNPNQGWLLTESTLQFNPSIRNGGQWTLKFNRRRFNAVTGIQPLPGYRHRRIQASKSRPDYWYLVIDNGAPSDDRKRYVFLTTDLGDSWRMLKAIDVAGVGRPGRDDEAPLYVINRRGSSLPTVTESTKETAKQPKTKSEGTVEEIVDLTAAISDKGSSDAGTSTLKVPGHPGGTTPLFKLLFDLWLDVRPGVTPLTFDNYHTFILLDVLPVHNWRFSAEVSPAPHYYEVGYQITPSVEFRGGRIWIPFDQIEPHNLYGGFYELARLAEPGAVAFLPDLWTDLGVAVRALLVDQKALSLEGQFYVVNGFGTGGGVSDPKGEVGTNYPNFGLPPSVDNNTDKAVGFRLHGMIENRFGLGVSFYEGRWTNNGDVDRRIVMLGADTQFQFTSWTRLRAGYIYMYVGLPASASQTSFNRGGLYVEGQQKFTDRWKVILRGGTVQNDSRVIQVSDQSILGGELVYDTGYFQAALIYNHDTNVVPGKANYELSALRATVMF